MIEQLKTIREALEQAASTNPFGDRANFEAKKASGKAISALTQLEAMAESVEPVAKLHDDGYWTPMKTEAGRALNDRLMRAGSPSIDVYAAPVAQQPVGEVRWAADVPDTIKEVKFYGDAKPPVGTKLYSAPVAQQYEAGDVASASAQGFRDGVASVAQQPSKAQLEKLREWETSGELIDRAWSVLQSQEQEIMRLEKTLAEERAQQPQAEAMPVAVLRRGEDGAFSVSVGDYLLAVYALPPGNHRLFTRPQQAEAVPQKPKLIGWRTGDYLMETSDKDKADNWAVHNEILPIFEGDPYTKLVAAPQQAEAVQACGHPMSLLLRSAESNEPLYCEACDDKSGRHDAERRETELLDANRRLQEKIASADALKLHAIEELCQLGYTVKDGELIPPDHLHKLVEAAGHPLAAPQQAEAPQNWRTLLLQSEDNFVHQFGVNVSAAWVYRDLEELFTDAAQQAESVQCTRADLDRAYSAGLVEGERLAIQQTEAVPSDVVRDAERLDYLQHNGSTVELLPGVGGFLPMRFRVGGLHVAVSESIRGAIDAAIAAQGEKP